MDDPGPRDGRPGELLGRLPGTAAPGPALRTEYELGLTQIGVVLAASNIGALATLLPWGLLADRIGERAVIAVGLAASAAALAGAAFAPSYGILVVALTAAGAAGACVNAASGRAVLGWFAAPSAVSPSASARRRSRSAGRPRP